MQFKTYINYEVPRVKSSERIKTIKVLWAENYERHTYLFERLTIDLLKATKNQTQTAKLLRIGLSIDEKSFKKGHNYVTVVSSPLTGNVIDACECREKDSTKELLEKILFQNIETK